MVAVEAGGAMYDIGTSADKSTVIEVRRRVHKSGSWRIIT